MSAIFDGKSDVEGDGFLYRPSFMSVEEGAALIDFVGALEPLWEERYRDGQRARHAANPGRLTRPVYWLGGWQFACLGYYAEPEHREHRCVRSDPMPEVLLKILERCRELLRERGAETLPNTCLINFYGREVGQGPPVDLARLRMHRDSEPGPVLMLCLGQPGLLEFVEPERNATPELSVWTRHRSLSILSTGRCKDALYHRVSQVRLGALPAMHSPVPNFELRRVSLSFRYVPESFIHDWRELPKASREATRDYVESLAASSPSFRAQLPSSSSSSSSEGAPKG